MTVTHLTYAATHAHIGVTLGSLQRITPHTGCDQVPSMSLRFEHGVVQMGSCELSRLMLMAAEAISLQGGAR